MNLNKPIFYSVFFTLLTACSDSEQPSSQQQAPSQNSPQQASPAVENKPSVTAVTIKGISWANDQNTNFLAALSLTKEVYGDDGGCIAVSGKFNDKGLTRYSFKPVTSFPGASYRCGKVKKDENASVGFTLETINAPATFDYDEPDTYNFDCTILNACKLTQGEFAQFVVDNLPIRQLQGPSTQGGNYTGRAVGGEKVFVTYFKDIVVKKGTFGSKGPSLN